MNHAIWGPPFPLPKYATHFPSPTSFERNTRRPTFAPRSRFPERATAPTHMVVTGPPTTTRRDDAALASVRPGRKGRPTRIIDQVGP